MKIGRAKVLTLRQLFETGIRVGEISQPLYSFNAKTSTLEARKLMNKLNYNVAGVISRNRVIGYIERESLKRGQCSDYIKRFKKNYVIQKNDPLLSSLHIFKTRTYVFVKDRDDQVKYIITHSDLQRIPVRMMVFGLLSLMELYFTAFIRLSYPKGKWMPLLSKTRIKKAEEVLTLRKKRNEDIDLVECLQFGDKKLIFEKTEQLAAATGKTKNALHDFFEDAETLRDNLAHVQDLLCGKSWKDTILLIEQIRDFISLCEKLEKKLLN